MVLTRAEKTAAMKHIVETVLDEAADSPVAKSLIKNRIKSPHDLLSIDDTAIDTFQYDDASGNSQPLALGERGLLTSFKAFVLFRGTGNNPITDADWTSITQEEYDNFRISPNNIVRVSNATPL